MTIDELPFTLPAMTSLPGLFSEGMDSPAKVQQKHQPPLAHCNNDLLRAHRISLKLSHGNSAHDKMIAIRLWGGGGSSRSRIANYTHPWLSIEHALPGCSEACLPCWPSQEQQPLERGVEEGGAE